MPVGEQDIILKPYSALLTQEKIHNVNSMPADS